MEKPKTESESDESESRQSPSKRRLPERWLAERWLAELNLLAVALIWGINLPIMKFALGEMDKYLFNALRLTFSTAVLGLFVLLQKGSVIDRTQNAKPVWQQVLFIGLFGVMTGFAYQVLFLWGIDQTSAGNTAVILSGIPIWIAILALLLLGERLSRNGWIGLAVAVVGTLVVTLSKSSGRGNESSVVGNLLVAGSAFSWALASVISRPMMKNISPVALAFWSLAIVLPLHYLVAKDSFAGFAEVTGRPILLAALIYSGIFSTGLAYAMWNYGVKKIGPAHAGAFQNLVPLVALFASWVLIGELPYPLQLLGGGLIIVGLIVMRRRSI